MNQSTLRRLLIGLSLASLLTGLVVVGCAHLHKPVPDLPFSFYHSNEFRWRNLKRLVILPLVNETTFPQAAEEIQRSLHAELQQLGRFEVIPVSSLLLERLNQRLRETGRFNEADLVYLARSTGADAVLFGTVTHYSPYFRPRIGLTIHVISPDLGKVISSVDGLWDSNYLPVADRARLHYSRVRSLPEHVIDYAKGTFDDAYGTELVLSSPHLYQRYVCWEVARLLVADPEQLKQFYPPAPPVMPAPPSPLVDLEKFCKKLKATDWKLGPGECKKSGSKGNAPCLQPGTKDKAPCVQPNPQPCDLQPTPEPPQSPAHSAGQTEPPPARE